jgi:hypothetical protein
MLGKICLSLNIDKICKAEEYREPGACKTIKPKYQKLENLDLKFSKFSFRRIFFRSFIVGPGRDD